MAPYVVKNIIPEYGMDPICIVSPDAGGVARAKMFLECLNTMNVSNIGLAITVKHRSGPGEVEGMNVVGEIEGKHCIIVDDMIDTGESPEVAASKIALESWFRAVMDGLMP